MSWYTKRVRLPPLLIGKIVSPASRPYWELSIALHDLSIDEKEFLLAGYKLAQKKILKMVPAIKAINIINYAPEIERLLAEKDFARVEQYRTRLSGALDFYCL